MKIQLYFRLTDDTNIPTLSQQPDYLILLTKSRWDDYGFKVTFDIQIIDYTITPPSIINLGAIKIGYKGQSLSDPISSHEFFNDYFSKEANDRALDSLPTSFFSLPEYDSYYSDINNFFSNNTALIDQYFIIIKDVLVNKLQEKVFPEQVFKKAFQRTMCFSSHEEFQWLYLRSKPIDIFSSQIERANKILNADYQDFLEDEIYVMLHGFLIATLENYLSNTFIKAVMSSDELILEQASKDGKIKDKKYKIHELVQGKELLKQDVLKSLQEMSFHNVETIIPMFKDILKCDLQDLTWLIDAVEIRHDCAHRGGYTKNQKKIEIAKESLEILIENIVRFVKEIQEQVYVDPKYLNQTTT